MVLLEYGVMVAQQILVLFVEVRILIFQLLFYSMDGMLIIVLLLLFVKMIIILSENDYDEITIVIACESSNNNCHHDGIGRHEGLKIP